MATQSIEHGWVPELTFGARLALIRQRYGWNVKEAAIACRLPVQSWRGWERDHTQPRRYLEVCRTIAEATGASYDWLLDGRRFPSPRSAHTTRYAERDSRKKVTVRNEEDTSSLSLEEAA
jgi:transcriptional regulator with XRE-family HTH domain